MSRVSVVVVIFGSSRTRVRPFLVPPFFAPLLSDVFFSGDFGIPFLQRGRGFAQLSPIEGKPPARSIGRDVGRAHGGGSLSPSVARIERQRNPGPLPSRAVYVRPKKYQ